MRTPYKIIPLLAASVLALLPGLSLACSIVPSYGKTTEEILKVVDREKGFGQLNTAQFNSAGRQVFAVWYCPYSGRGDCFLHAYYYDYDKAQWTMFADREVEGSHSLTVELPCGEDVVIFKRFDGKVELKQPLTNIPAKKSDKEAEPKNKP